MEDRALTTSNTTLNYYHETENVTKAVDHKPIDRKTCTNDFYLIDRGHSSNTFNIDACFRQKVIIHKKKFWPSKCANYPQIFKKKGSLMTPKNSGLAETLYNTVASYSPSSSLALFTPIRGVKTSVIICHLLFSQSLTGFNLFPTPASCHQWNLLFYCCV